MKGVRWFVHEWRTGWNQGVIGRAEARLARMGERPYPPIVCSVCKRRRR